MILQIPLSGKALSLLSLGLMKERNKEKTHAACTRRLLTELPLTTFRIPPQILGWSLQWSWQLIWHFARACIPLPTCCIVTYYVFKSPCVVLSQHTIVFNVSEVTLPQQAMRLSPCYFKRTKLWLIWERQQQLFRHWMLWRTEGSGDKHRMASADRMLVVI